MIAVFYLIGIIIAITITSLCYVLAKNDDNREDTANAIRSILWPILLIYVVSFYTYYIITNFVKMKINLKYQRSFGRYVNS